MQPLEQQRRIEQELAAVRPLLAKTLPTDLSEEVAAVCRCIHMHLFDPSLNVGQVRQRCGITSNTFCARFKHATGRTLRGYIEERRLWVALRLLHIDGLEVYAIATSTGFPSYGTFNRTLQRALGCTASVFRDTLRALEQRPAVPLDRPRSSSPEAIVLPAWVHAAVHRMREGACGSTGAAE